MTSVVDAASNAIASSLSVSTPQDGRFLSGMEALIEGVFAFRRSEPAGETAAFISGYRGSPLGAFDSLLWGKKEALKALDITFKPGLNEDLAATACWGTQQLALMSKPKYAGVTAFWYGKGPGVDRAGDVLKHGNMAGTSPRGGVVLFVGDDHGAKSSTVAHQSDQALAAAGIPVLYPATIQEYVDCIPLAVELSRFASVWVAIKCVTETVESSMRVNLNRTAVPLIRPELPQRPGGHHIGSGHIPLEQERSLFAYRLPAVKRFVDENTLDRITHDSATRGLGIIAPGKSYIDVIEALRLLGISKDDAQRLGVRIFKPLMVWPLAPSSISAFARAHREVLIVEEKRSFIEEQLAGMLLRLADVERPALSGKSDPSGAALLSDHGELSPTSVAHAIGARLVALGIAEPSVEARWRSLLRPSAARAVLAPPRMAAFCSGCPHNRSTRLPDGSMAFGGIGCHGMALFVPELRTPSATHMGGEGANWIGLEDFVGDQHIFQNMGEGTYTHSGLLAIRATIAAQSNITHKILHNGATAMTGGQPVEGAFSAEQIAAQLLAEGVKKVTIVTEDPERKRILPESVQVLPRTELDRVQRELRQIRGVTALIYEQGCAAERRRLRKAKQYPDPAVRTYINPAVCEGCGDCGRKSNCVSIVPLETEFGRKRSIDQESCNKDYSCVEGFCPSFVTVTGGVLRTNQIGQAMLDNIGALLADPPVANRAMPWNMVLSGIGGTGIVTLGGAVARAAMLDGMRVSSFDVTGLAQKNGPVYSHLRLFDTGDQTEYQPRIPDTQLDVLIGCDVAGSSTVAVRGLLSGDRTRAFVNHSLVPTASFQRNPDQSLDVDAYIDVLAETLPPPRLEFFSPGEALRRAVGQGALMNIVALGFAFQRGAIPIAPASMESALSRSGRVDMKSVFAFRAGRLLAQDKKRLESLLDGERGGRPVAIAELPIEDAIARYGAVLSDYQNRAYAQRYTDAVRRVQTRDSRGALTRAYANSLFRLMRYKDEYEVARLFTMPEFMAGLRQEFAGDITLGFNLAPPLLAFRKNSVGEPKKIRFGSWLYTVFKGLAHFKFLRGTPFDPFGATADRRLERALISEYLAWVDRLVERIDSIDYDLAVRIAELPLMVRGYGPVKDRSVTLMRQEFATLWPKL